MYNILFICYGNICRSPMAEMIFKDIVIQNNKRFLFHCESKATSMEEFGNDIYPKAKRTLENHHIIVEKHMATIVKKEDYSKYQYIICMDSRNYQDLLRIFGEDPEHKIKLLLSFTGEEEEIEDPWYTGRFEYVYNQIYEGCMGLFKVIAYSNWYNIRH